MKTIELHNYNIYITDTFDKQEYFREFITQKKYTSVFILADENTRHHCLPVITSQLKGIDHTLIVIPAGEKEKNIDTCNIIWQSLIDHNAGRKSLLINLGGGVIGDMGGFVASTFKRGMEFINIPTTLLSQVDASVGGKLGIDFSGMKNIIGVFNNPAAIFISTDFLSTLPFEQLRSGFAEVLKHALIFDKNYWAEVKHLDIRDPAVAWPEIVAKSVEIKRKVVLDDMYESGVRKILNFGHTIGHAIEAYSLGHDPSSLLHGEAIAIGMICEAYLAHKTEQLSTAEMREVTETLLHYFPEYPLMQADHQELLQIMKHDKKNAGELISFSLIYEIGECDFDKNVPVQLIKESFEYYASVS